VRDLPPEEALAGLDTLEGDLERARVEYRRLLLDNRAWVERVDGLGGLGKDEARGWALDGVVLRAAGGRAGSASTCGEVTAEDLSKTFGFRLGGDVRARTWLRWAEIGCHVRAARDALRTVYSGVGRVGEETMAETAPLPGGAPALVEHFERWMDGHGLRPPAGRQAYVPVAGPEGEVGFLLISDGTGRPYRAHLRAPGLFAGQASAALARGIHHEDLGLLLASLPMDALEQDR